VFVRFKCRYSAKSSHPQSKYTCSKAAVRGFEPLKRVACCMTVMREIHSGRVWSFTRLLVASPYGAQ
jgi:hypothetical protein